MIPNPTGKCNNKKRILLMGCDYGKCLLLLLLSVGFVVGGATSSPVVERRKNAYATMMYMGTPRDYEFYVATRVMLRSLADLRVNADRVVIASMDVPLRWIRALEEEDGARVVRVKNVENPYSKQRNFDMRFKLTLNKIYAWSLVEYERVVMLDSDNLFLKNTDELFQCGQFCAVFINPCIFHTGLFVLEPSASVFEAMLRDIHDARENPDGADQGFIGGQFPDLLDQPMFHTQPPGEAPLNGTFRLPLGYQMDASYFYLKLRWSIPCGPNSVITFPSAPLMKPWYWWSWPVLPLGIAWHEQRRRTLGYADELAAAAVQALMYVALGVAARLARPNMAKVWQRRGGYAVKGAVGWSVVAAYAVPFMVVPRTIHPVVGWGLYMVGSMVLSMASASAFMVPVMGVLVPWFGILGSLVVMAWPFYTNGIVRALCVFAYACLCMPFLSGAFQRLFSSLDKELIPTASSTSLDSSKLC